jgi:hypothetical protein
VSTIAARRSCEQGCDFIALEPEAALELLVLMILDVYEDAAT